MRLLLLALFLAVLAFAHYCTPHNANAATLAGVCRATKGFMVRNQCRWPLRISQQTTRKACKSVGGTFVLTKNYQGCK